MKLLVLSDTHGDIQTMEQVIAHRQDVDVIIHCGDSELDFSYFKDSPVHVVRGNCDMDTRFPKELILPVGDETIYVAHGHKHQVKSTLMPLFYRAQEVQASIVCFGHSHVLGAEVSNGVLFVNPGSLRLPRGRIEKSYAMIEKLELKWSINFYSPDHIVIENIIL